GATTAVAPPAAPAASGARRGVVRETMDSGGYTYLRVEGDGASAWVAVPVTALAVGDEVEVPAGNEMPGFHSRTLDRTFAQLTFASGVRVVRGGVAPAPAPAVLPPGHPPIAGRASPDGVSH
ncbi:MAG: repeat-containing lipoprotein, partial [Myxococcaceae bacterium]|nr:repeat-containing lipoprotein [Myxococcaceae bacterium]